MCKNAQRNVSKSNTKTYKKNYTPQQSGIYLRYRNLVQHLKINYCSPFTSTGLKNHMIISTDEEKASDNDPTPFHDKNSQ